MNKQVSLGLPTACIAINRSRVKIYNKNTDVPTVYLQKGTEFQIELFNPTTDVILCKINLNNKQISQGGLVLNPGQRVFLDRYLDVAKKFLFDTYEVSNTNEVKEAIEQNGDFKVEFYKEYVYQPIIYTNQFYNSHKQYNTENFCGVNSTITATKFGDITSSNTNFIGDTTFNGLNDNLLSCCCDTIGSSDEQPLKKDLNKLRKRSKTIETGRVEEGSKSNQEFKTVNKSWAYSPFHSVEYKLLPISQKINTVKDIQVAKYCTNCAHKLKPEYKFCPSCANRI